MSKKVVIGELNNDYGKHGYSQTWHAEMIEKISTMQAKPLREFV